MFSNLSAELWAALTSSTQASEKLLHRPFPDWADEVFLMSNEAVRLDLNEMARHLQDPYFTGQSPKVHIFFHWFKDYFFELVRLSHDRATRLLDTDELSPCATAQGVEAAREDVEREMGRAQEMMSDICRLKASFLRAQLDDQTNVAEELRVKVGVLDRTLRRCMLVEEESIAPALRNTVDAQDAAAALHRELQADHVGLLPLSMWLPWACHAMDRWRPPRASVEFQQRLPWLEGSMLQLVWEPLYLRNNWGLLQSMADPIEGDDTPDDTVLGHFPDGPGDKALEL